jgi:hypothetical protein
MENKLNFSIFPKRVFFIFTFLLSFASNWNESFGQIRLFDNAENKFSNQKLQKQTDSTKAKKQSGKKKVNMKISVYAGLLSGGLIGIGSYLTDKKSHEQPQREREEYGYEIDLPPTVILIGGFVLGFAIGFVITGAIMQARLRHPDNDQLFTERAFPTRDKYVNVEYPHRAFRFFRYEYKF